MKNCFSTLEWVCYQVLIHIAFAGIAFSAANVEIAPKPQWLVPVTPSGKKPAAKNISDGYYVAFSDVQVYTDKQTTYTRVIRDIVSESGIQNGSEITVVFDPSYQKIRFHEVIVWRDGVAIPQLKNAKFSVVPEETDRHRFIYNGIYSASLPLKDIRKGDKIEFSYSRIGWNPVFLNKYSTIFNFGAYDYISHTHYAIHTGPQHHFSFKEFNKPPAKTVKQTGGLTVYEWDLKNIRSIPYEDYLPSWFTTDPFVQISEYTSWEEVVEWGLQFYQTPVVSGALKLKTEEWKRRANGSQHEYINLATRFVQDEIRYLGIEIGQNSHRPHAPDEVFRQRYGDCKDKAFLLCAVLKANNIECDPVLVDTYKKSHLSDYLPGPQNFNHVIARVRTLDEKVTFIDATYSMQGGTVSNYFLPAYGQGLILKTGQTAPVSIPLQNPGMVTVTETFGVPVVTDTAAIGSLLVKTVYFGGEADNFREQFQQDNQAETEESYLNYYQDSYKKAEFQNVDSLEHYDQRDANNFSLFEKYSIKHAWQYDSTRRKYSFPIFGKILYDKLITLPGRTRKSPISLQYPYHLQYTIQLRLPDQRSISKQEWTVKRDSYIITFKSKLLEEENMWELYYEYETLKDHVSVSQSNDFRLDMEKLVENLEYELHNTDTSQPMGNLNNWTILVWILSLSLGLVTWKILSQYSPLQNIGYQSSREIGGWLVLLVTILILQPFVQLSLFFNGFSIYFTKAGWNALSAQPVLKIMIYRAMLVIEVCANTLFFVGSIFLIFLFVKKRDSFPIIFSIMLGARILFSILDLTASALLLDSDSSNKAVLMEIVRQIIFGAIWIPYLYKSVRAQNTFVNISPT